MAATLEWYFIEAAELIVGGLILIICLGSVVAVLVRRKLQFNYAWAVRLFLVFWAFLWVAAFYLQLEFLWSPSWGFFAPSALVQSQLCLSYVTLFHGFAEPSLLASICQLIAVHSRLNPKLGPGRAALVRWLPLFAPAAGAAVAVVLLNLVYPAVAPAFVSAVYDSGSAQCQSPLLSVGVGAAITIAAVVYLNVSATRVAALLMNRSLRAQLVGAQIVLSVCLLAGALLRVALPFIGSYYGPIILHSSFAVNVITSLFSIAYLVLHPLRTAAAQPMTRRSGRLSRRISAGTTTAAQKELAALTGKDRRHSQRYSARGTDNDTGAPTTPRSCDIDLTAPTDADGMHTPTDSAAVQAPQPVTPWDPRVRPLHKDNDPVRVRGTPFVVRLERAMQRVEKETVDGKVTNTREKEEEERQTQ